MSSDSLVGLDMETTEMAGDAEVVQTGVAQRGGDVLVDSLVNPTRPVPPDDRAATVVLDYMAGRWTGGPHGTVDHAVPHKNPRRACCAAFVTERDFEQLN